MNLGLYVGSFNPVHKDHIKIVKGLLKKQIVDKILLVPTKDYWDKTNLLALPHRIKMLKFYETPNIIVDEKRNAYDYTYQIIEEIKCAGIKVFLIIGADNLEKFHLWKEVNLIMQNKIIVVGRDGLDVNKYINNFTEKDNFIIIDDLNTRNLAATDIREKIKNKECLKGFLTKKVIDYIKKEKLYGGE